MGDIVQRLRDTWPVTVTAGEVRNDCLEAADEIERLREQNLLLAMDKIELRGRLAAMEAE
jgi:hypothetical protein